MKHNDPYKVRASSWGALFDCAYKWEGTQLLGMSKPSGLRAALGTALHASTAAFDQGRVLHTGLRPDDAAGVLVDKLAHPDYEVDMAQDDLTAKDAERIGLTLHTKYCLEMSPRYDFRAVELTTKPFQIDCGGSVIIELTGTLDRSRMFHDAHGGEGIADLKSGSAAVQKGVAKTKGHAAQLGTYELLYEHTTGLQMNRDSQIIGLKTKGTPEVAAGTVRGAKLLMTGNGEYRGLIEFAADMFRTGLFPPNPQSLLCAEKYCARWHQCPYHDQGE